MSRQRAEPCPWVPHRPLLQIAAELGGRARADRAGMLKWTPLSARALNPTARTSVSTFSFARFHLTFGQPNHI
jgi:hypothetical protein